MKSAKLLGSSIFVLAMITTITGCFGDEEKTSVTKGKIELKSDTDKAADESKLETIVLGA